MHNQPSSPSQTGAPTELRNTQMISSLLSGNPDDPAASSIFDWSDLLEFDLHEQLSISFDDPLHQEQQTETELVAPVIPSSEDSPQSQDTDAGRIRKRDPRMACSNFLAGRIPCACPELDEKMEEEEMAGIGPGKKRARTVRASAGAGARCQVPDCEADISELKGYHKRHRVCLRCANATAVVLDGHSKRYCQQCGKYVYFFSDEYKKLYAGRV